MYYEIKSEKIKIFLGFFLLMAAEWARYHADLDLIRT